MLTCKIICICAFTFITTNAAFIQDLISNNKEINYRLPNHTKPLMYDIKLNPHLIPDNFTFDGQVFIHVKILSETKTLTLHTKKLIIDKNSTVLKANNGVDYYFPTTYETNNLTELLTLSFDKELPAGYYVLHLKYTGVLNDRSYGFYRNSYINEAGDTVWFAGTNFIATYARAAFPCWDEPALKASFKISIKHHCNYTAISNMPVSEESDIDKSDKKIWTHFKESPAISTYLVGFLIFDLCNTSNSDGTINVWSRGNVISLTSFAHEVAQKAAIELKRYTNSSVQLTKIDHVALPDRFVIGYNKGMESWGLITYREVTILYDEENSPIDALYRIADNIIRQSSHQWFSNVVSPTWWTDTWINEGLAEYLKYYVTDKIYKDWRITDFLVIKTLNFVFLMDSFEHTQPLNVESRIIKDINLQFSSQHNHKAFLIFRMLSHCLSDDVFHAGLVKYLNKHKYGVATPEDLWNALQDEFNESAGQNKLKIQEIINTWVKQKGYPLVTAIRDYTGKIKITQEYFRPYEKISMRKSINNADTVSRWWIPINLVTRANSDFSSTLPTNWLSPDVEELVINDTDTQDWIIINVQQTGFYRVNYDAINWLKIANYLDSENYTKIHVLNRARIINDAIYLMFMDKLDPKIFMDITRYLRRETNYVVWYSLFKLLEEATKFFSYNGGGELLKPYILNSMNNIIETTRMQHHPSDDYFTKLTRNALLDDACVFDHPTCLYEAYNQLITYLDNSTILANKISFHKKRWIFCNGIKLANETIWNRMLYMYTNMSEPTLYCLGQSKNRTIIEKFLNITISENSMLAKSDIYRVIYSVLNGDFPNIDVVIDFVINHWDKLITSIDDPTDLLHDISWTIVSRKQIQKIRALLDKVGMKVPQIVKLQEQNIELTESIVNNIRVWLEHESSNPFVNTISQ
ncbi:hypothetical protein PUN28_012805 [Cardiocondyla obscurior]|uniref:Aminopeptidase n=1 Tax=Cardiocondyla obscurior TaxID=286306 RepID=A0AAW2F6I7_9HYME